MSHAALTGIFAMQAIRNDGLSGAELPKRLKLLNWGVNETLKGKVTVGTRTLTALSAKQAERGFDKVGIDYEHQSLPGHPNFKPSPREYAAYGVPRVVEGEGLFLDEIEWTPSGQANARNYIDLSPAPLIEQGEVTFLHSVALCPQGAVKDLSFFSAEFSTPKKITTYTMNPELIKLLAALFNVPETSTEEELLAAAKTFAEKAAKKPEGEVTPMSAEIKNLTEGQQAILDRLDNQERDNLIAQAVRDGKIVPNSAKDLPIATFKALIAELPADQVPLDKRTPANIQALSASVSATDLAVCKQLGLTPEEFNK